MSVQPETPPVKTAEELQSEIAKLQSDKASLVGETQDLRKARQEKEEEIETLKTLLKQATDKNNANPEEEKIKSVIQQVLGQRDQQSAEQNRKAAFDKFVAENNEYHPDNDTGGLKLAALQKEFNGFNTTGLVTEDDFGKVIGKAHALLRGTGTPRQTETENPYSSTPNQPALPPAQPDKELSEQEQKLIERNGWSKEKFLALKVKDPRMIEELTAVVRP